MEELQRMEADVLRRLELLSEGGTLDYDRPNLHRVHPSATPPPGYSESAVLSPRISLAGYHAVLLANACERGTSSRLMAIAAAEKDYELSLRRPPAYLDADPDVNAHDRDEAILRWVGKRPEEAAVWESCSYSYVRKVRRAHKRDQMTGEPLEETEGCAHAA